MVMVAILDEGSQYIFAILKDLVPKMLHNAIRAQSTMQFQSSHFECWFPLPFINLTDQERTEISFFAYRQIQFLLCILLSTIE